MEVDRELQNRILRAGLAAYPNEIELSEFEDVDPDHLLGNVLYLRDHQTVEARVVEYTSADRPSIRSIKVTKSGIDLLQGDGGLSAVLGVVTVRFHEETLRALIEAKVMESDLEVSAKAELLKGVKKLPADAIKALVLKLVDLGFRHGADALSAVRNYVT